MDRSTGAVEASKDPCTRDAFSNAISIGMPVSSPRTGNCSCKAVITARIFPKSEKSAAMCADGSKRDGAPLSIRLTRDVRREREGKFTDRLSFADDSPPPLALESSPFVGVVRSEDDVDVDEPPWSPSLEQVASA